MKYSGSISIKVDNLPFFNLLGAKYWHCRFIDLVLFDVCESAVEWTITPLHFQALERR
jgi:hypothetical protein